MNNRRDFLKKMSSLTAGSLLAGSTSTAGVVDCSYVWSTAASKILGLQIYAVQRELLNDIPKGLNDLRDMGYINLELAGYYKGMIGNLNILEFKQMVEDAGLKIVSSHVNPEIEGQPSMISGQERVFPYYTREMLPQVREYWKVTADDHVKYGCKYLIQPMMPRINTHEDAELVCEFLNEAGKICNEAGLIFAYHNHDFEFRRERMRQDLIAHGQEEATKSWIF